MNITEHTIHKILVDLEVQADRIVEIVQHQTTLANPLMFKVLSLHKALTALQHIAQWSNPAEGPALDEPHATTTARQTLESIAKLYER
jgi:hypothetical protein